MKHEDRQWTSMVASTGHLALVLGHLQPELSAPPPSPANLLLLART